MKVTVVKNVFNGEQVSVELDHADVGRRLEESLARAYAVVDARLIEMNRRVMEGSHYLRAIAKHYPWLYAGITRVVDVLGGQADLSQMPETLPEFRCPGCRIDIHERLQADAKAQEADLVVLQNSLERGV